MGSIFDRSCLVWQHTCDQKGSCWMYDTVNMSVSLAVMTFAALSISCVCLVSSILTYKLPPKLVETERVTEMEVDCDNNGTQADISVLNPECNQILNVGQNTQF